MQLGRLCLLVFPGHLGLMGLVGLGPPLLLMGPTDLDRPLHLEFPERLLVLLVLLDLPVPLDLDRPLHPECLEAPPDLPVLARQLRPEFREHLVHLFDQ